MPPDASRSSEEGGPLARLFAGMRPGEGRVAFAAGAWFFCLMAAYYALRPLRDSFGSENPYEFHWLFTGTFAITAVAQPLYGRLVARYGRAVFLPVTYRFLAVNVLVFAVVLGNLEGEALRWAHRVYFCWLSAFVVFGVSVFWGFLADLMGPRRAKRLYGLIALGGTLGAALGSVVAGGSVALGELVGALGLGSPSPGVVLPVTAAVFLELAVRAARFVERTPRPPEDDDPGSDASEPVGGGPFDGFREVAASGYLRALCGYVVVFVAGSTMLYFIQSVIARDAYPDGAERTAFFGHVDLAVNGIVLVLQLFATGRVLQRLGLGVALAAVPLVGVVGFGAVSLAPTVAVLVPLYVLRRAAEFGFSKPARDALFTAVSREEKYKAKSVIDATVYRGGDAVVMWIRTALERVAGFGPVGLARLLVPVCLAGVALAAYLGREHRRRTAAPLE